MSSYEARLAALREQLKRDRLDGFVVPLTDEHMSEYVGSYAQRLAWLTGFQGSAGSAVVLPEEAAIFTDGRYTLQVRDQVDGAHWSYQSVPETSIADWLKAHAPDGGRIGYDPWLHTREWVEKARAALAAKGAELVAVGRNPIDAVWNDRPEPSRARLMVQPDALYRPLLGREAAGHGGLAEGGRRRHGGARGARFDRLDLQRARRRMSSARPSRSPSPWSMTTARPTSSSTGEKIGDDVRQHLGNGVRLHERSAFEPALDGAGRARRWRSIRNARSRRSSARSMRPARK